MDRLQLPSGITPYFVDHNERVVLYCGDSRSILPHFVGTNTISGVFSDPPYGMDYCTGHRNPTHPGGLSLRNHRMKEALLAPIDGDAAEDANVLLAETADILSRVLTENSVGYWFCSPLKIHEFVPILSRNFTLKNILVWDKVNHSAGDLSGSYGRAWEAVLYFTSGVVPLVGKRDQDIIRVSKGFTGAYVHPTQKPVSLMNYLISKSDTPIILDPFAGSGSTLIAAKMLGRMAIGIEINEIHCKTAVNRLSQTNLFALPEEEKEWSEQSQLL